MGNGIKDMAKYGFHRPPRIESWQRGAGRIVPIRDPGSLFASYQGKLQARGEVLTAAGITDEIMVVQTNRGWDGGTSLVNNQRGQRPLLPALSATENQALKCPVCEQQEHPNWKWEMPDRRILTASAPERPTLPHQVNIPLSLEHKTNIRDLRPEEFIYTLLFAREIINEQISKIEGADPVAYIHLGAVGTSIVHPHMVLGAMIADALFSSQSRFDMVSRYWSALSPPRDIIWEENKGIIEGGLRDYFIRKVGGGSDINRGFLVHAPFTPIASYHLRVNALQEGNLNLSRLNNDQVAQLGYAVWLSVNLLGKLTDAQGQQAINNLAINFEMLPSRSVQENRKARMYVDVIPQEVPRAGMELVGLPVVTNPAQVAERARSLIGEVRENTIELLSQLHPFNNAPADIQLDVDPVREIFKMGRRKFGLETEFDPVTNTHLVTETSGDIERRVRYRWRKPWHGLHTTLIVPEGWSSGFSHIDYPQDRKPSRDRCFACDTERLAHPHFEMDIKPAQENQPVVPVRLVTNAFGFAAGIETAEQNPYGSDVRVLLGKEIDKFKVMPSHILSFTPDHLVGLDQLSLKHEKALFKIWQSAVLKIFGKNPMNNRPICLVNLGIEAGATLTHFHTQLLEVARDAWGTVEKQIALVDAEGQLILEEGKNPYNLAHGLALLEGKVASRDLMAEISKVMNEKGLVLFEDDNVLVYAEDAPMFPYETVIRAKRLGANSIVYLKPEERSSFAKAMDLLRQMYLSIKVEDMNIVDESAQYDNRDSCWRYGVRLAPRRIAGNVKRIGALDLKGIYLVPVSPEMAVRELLQAGNMI